MSNVMLALAGALTLAGASAGLASGWTAHPLDDTPITVRSEPAGAARLTLDSLTGAGRALGLLVIGEGDVNGERWLRVRLPVRPNDAAGWVRATDVDLRQVPWRVTIDLSERRLWLYAGSTVAMRSSVVVGKPQTPTPTGLFALWQTVPGRTGSTAPYELHLTAHSNVLTSFMGGPGRVAIHGMRGALVAPLGIAASNGCIRIPDAPLRRLARQLPPGAPILIRE